MGIKQQFFLKEDAFGNSQGGTGNNIVEYGEDGQSQGPDWCGRTSASMVYNYFQLIKGRDPRPHYITHSRAGDPACLLDLRYPTGAGLLAPPLVDGWGVCEGTGEA